jgi:Domain of unknown function (DUF4167)
VRQGQQNRRGRGRNRKSQNPLARSFESNGPDVKIRGTPAHIAEKYISLARDAQSSGDPVLAENYLQHAEHYSRIIMAYREQMHQAGEGYNGNGQQRLRGPNEGLEGGDDFGEDDAEDLLDEGGFPQPTFQSSPQHAQGHAQGHPPPRQHGGYDNNRHERPFRRDHGRFRDRDRNADRERHNDRERGDRQPFETRPQPQPERAEPAAEAAPNAPEQQPPRRRERFQPQPPHEQPEFLRRPVRRARGEEEAPEANGKEEPSRE